jgi:hypothetical protein
MVANIISRIEDAGRRAHVAEQLKHPGLSCITDVRWFPAMCPDGIKWGAMNTRVRGMRRQSAFGCLLSHFHVLQQCYLNGLDALIFEDDFLPMPGFALDIPTELGADMYYPGWITWGAEHVETPVTADWHRRAGFAGTHAYFVPHNRLLKVLAWYEKDPWQVQIDNALSTANAAGKLDMVFKSGPRIVQNPQLVTTIGNAPHQSDINFAYQFIKNPF